MSIFMATNGMASYSVAQARDNLPRLIDRAIGGEEVVITRRGTPLVELRPRAERPLPAHWIERLEEMHRRWPAIPGPSAVELIRGLREDRERG